MTMEIKKPLACHTAALNSLFPSQTVSATTHWQDRTDIARVIEGTVDSTQPDMQFSMRIMSTDNHELLAMMPHTSSTNSSHTGQHDAVQCRITDGRLIKLNKTPEKVTPTPIIAHADTTTHYHTKIQEKITLQFPQHQSNHYKNIVINQTATGTIASNTTTAYHHHIHACTQNDETRPTHPPTNDATTTTSTVSYPYDIASDTFSPTANHIRQQNSTLPPNPSQQRTPQMPTDLPQHTTDASPGNADMKIALSHTQNISNDSVQPSQMRNHDNWTAHHNTSHSFTKHDNGTSNQTQFQQPWQIAQQNFDKDFWDIQQQIQETYCTLEDKIKHFLAFFEQRQDNLSPIAPSAPK